MTYRFDLSHADSSWHTCIKQALLTMDQSYLNELYQDSTWLPGLHNIFNAFSIPFNKVNYILFGESPYPRKESANGYAFWDAAVTEIWSDQGLSKKVNRATSLRNIIKMLLVAEGLLNPHQTRPEDIKPLDKQALVKTNHELFTNFLNQGFLLLNASLVLRSTPVKKDATAWHPFIKYLLHFIIEKNASVKLILFGQIAHLIDKIADLPKVTKLQAEHPYNLSFITQPNVLHFFKPLHLLIKK